MGKSRRDRIGLAGRGAPRRCGRRSRRRRLSGDGSQPGRPGWLGRDGSRPGRPDRGRTGRLVGRGSIRRRGHRWRGRGLGRRPGRRPGRGRRRGGGRRNGKRVRGRRRRAGPGGRRGRRAQLGRVEARNRQPGQGLALRRERPGVDGGAVGAGAEHLRGDHLAVGEAGHLPDGGDGPAPVGELLDVHQQVQDLGDLPQHRIRSGGVGGALRVDQDLVDGGLGAARVDGAHRAVVADAHGLQELHHLAAAHLAHDHPVRRHPQSGLGQVVHGDLAGALGVGGAGLQGQGALVQARSPQVQLEGVLDGHQQLALGHLRQQRPQQRGLARPRAPHHQQVGRVGRAHRRLQDRPDLRGDRPGLLKLAQRGREHPVAADDHRGALGHRGDGEQPVARGQPQVQDGRGGVEPPGGVAGGGGQMADQGDQLGLAGGHGRSGDAVAVGQRQHHGVVAQDVDVLHVGPVQQRVQAAAAHQAPDPGQEVPPVLFGELVPARDQSGGVVLLEDAVGDGHELAVDDVGGELLALHVEVLLEQRLVVGVEEVEARAGVGHVRSPEAAALAEALRRRSPGAR